MYTFKRLIILLFCSILINGNLLTKLNEKQEVKSLNFYKEWLREIKQQKFYDGLLIVQNSEPQDPRLQNIYTLREPKMIITDRNYLNYKIQFNSEILTIVIMECRFSSSLWQFIANTLNGIRQTRILLIMTNIRDIGKIQTQVLKESEEYHFTNVLMHFLNKVPTPEYFQLMPYPKYYFRLQEIGKSQGEYFPVHWRDMKGKAILTLPDQIIPRSMMYQDRKGRMKFTGFAAKLILLFVEQFNATLKMPHQPKINEVIHYSILYNRTKNGELDIPMSVYPVFHGETLKHLSTITEVSKWMIMIPCAPRMKISQVYEVLLTPELFSIIIMFTITFSLVHTLIDKLFYDHMIWLNLLMSDRVIPGILGQTFALKNSNLISLRMIYILIFVLGVYNSTIFSAHLQTLITSPPFQRPITSFEDLRKSGKKILLTGLDLQLLLGSDAVLQRKLADILEYTDNGTLYTEYRKNFNTTYAYKVTAALWQVFSNVQLYYVEKVFCVTEDMNIWDTLPYGFPLYEHSPYREPLNHIIHKVHAVGLLHAWKFQVFNDLLKLKEITLRDSSRIKTYDDLTEGDLLMVWLILAVGLAGSLMVFLVEILVYYCVKFYVQKIRIKVINKNIVA